MIHETPLDATRSLDCIYINLHLIHEMYSHNDNTVGVQKDRRELGIRCATTIEWIS